jgi:uncharacterized membrane protein
MNSLPLHPAIVHLPLGLAILMPLLAAGFAWALWSGRVRSRAWIAVVALQALLVGSGLAAMNTGEADEDRVEAVVQKSAIHQHEEYAEQFVWAAAATLLMTGLVLVFRQPKAARALATLAVVGTVAVAGMALRVGRAGGQLVYAHGAASAYTGAAKTSAATPARTPVSAPRQNDDADER